MFHKTTFGLINHFVRAYPKRSALVVVSLFLSGLLEGIGVMALLPLMNIMSDSSGGTDSLIVSFVTKALGVLSLKPTFNVLLAVVVVGITLKAACMWLAMWQVGCTIARVAADLRLRLIGALMRARWAYFVEQPAGRIAHAISSEAFRASKAYFEVAMVFVCLMQIIVYTVAAIMISWRVTLLATLFSAVLLYVLKGLIGYTRSAGVRRNKVSRSLVERLTDALQGIKPIKAMARETQLIPLLEAETQILNLCQRRLIVAGQTLKALQEPLIAVFLGAGVFVVSRVGTTSFSELMILAFLFYRLATRGSILQQEYQKLTINESAFSALKASIEQAESEKESVGGSLPPPPLNDSIRFEEVGFSHASDKPLLNRLSFTVPSGMFVAIEGPSGAGKTTLVDLIAGLVRPQSGEILVDGVPLESIDLSAWRRIIGYVPQETFLFHESVLRNITLGEDGIAREDVEAALRDAGALEFVSQLPQGTDTHLGERGSRLSGGERQRIAIARALMRHPRLLILDEVTTALDPVTEAGILETLQRLRGKVTIIAISHQRALVNAADRVFRLHNGTLDQLR